MTDSKADLLEKRKEQALEKVSIADLLVALRVDYNSGRKISCIFPNHREKTPSMVVYEHTNTVYCFGCGESGDVIRVVQTCVPTSGKVWPLSRALSWLEDEFDLPSPSALDSLSAKIGKTLKKGKAKEVEKRTTLARQQAINLIDNLLNEIQTAYPPEAKAIMGPVEDYVFDEIDRPGVDVLEWSVWAKKFVSRYYAKEIAIVNDWLGSEEFRQAANDTEEDFRLLSETHLDWDERIGT